MVVIERHCRLGSPFQAMNPIGLRVARNCCLVRRPELMNASTLAVPHAPRLRLAAGDGAVCAGREESTLHPRGCVLINRRNRVVAAGLTGAPVQDPHRRQPAAAVKRAFGRSPAPKAKDKGEAGSDPRLVQPELAWALRARGRTLPPPPHRLRAHSGQSQLCPLGIVLMPSIAGSTEGRGSPPRRRERTKRTQDGVVYSNWGTGQANGKRSACPRRRSLPS